MDFIGLSPATARLAVELQLADVKGIMQESVTGDEYAAFDVMRIRLQEALSLLQDQIYAIEVLRADYDGRVVFETLVREERQAEQDHNLACGLSGVTSHQSDCATPTHRPERQDEWLGDDCQSSYPVFTGDTTEDHIFSTLDRPVIGRSNEVAGNPTADSAESSTRQKFKGKGKAPEVSTHIFCSACMEPHPRFDILELGCKRPEDTSNHAYCRNCLVDLFQTSLTDTTLFPPRCCGKNISITACVELCPSALVKQYEEKQVELASPNPVYCSNRYCNKFVKPEYVTAHVATCQSCSEETCTVCKNPRHRGLCPDDPTTKSLMEMAGQQRWQRCPKCRTLVELLMGCYHMRCRCGGEFCYLCAKLWKTCLCSQWDENRLLSTHQIAHPPGTQIAMPEQAETLEPDPSLDILDDLQLRLATVAGGFAIANTEEDESSDINRLDVVGACSHRWGRSYGKQAQLEACGICHDRLKFVHVCAICKTKVCTRCLNNRL